MGADERAQVDPSGFEVAQGERSGGAAGIELSGANQEHSGRGPDRLTRGDEKCGELQAWCEQLRHQTSRQPAIRADHRRDWLLLAFDQLASVSLGDSSRSMTAVPDGMVRSLNPGVSVV